MTARAARGFAARGWRGLVAGSALAAAGCAVTAPALAPASGAPSSAPASAAPPVLAAASNVIVGPVWQWQRTQLADGRAVEAGVPERYTLQFEGGGRARLRADCNRGTAAYEVGGDAMTLKPPALTRMLCPPDSQDREFLRQLEGVAGYAVEGDALVLRLAGGGTMRFRRSGPGS